MALFEAPIAHEAVHYSNPESHYSNPEFEYEYEDESHPYSNPELEYEGLLGNIISGIGGLFGGGSRQSCQGHTRCHHQCQASERFVPALIHRQVPPV